jgi:hypothetical protein
LILK